jgi:alpha-amylase
VDWWDNGGDAIAFGRGAKGFVVLNHEAGPITATFRTSLPAGSYRDLQHDRTYTVDGTGRFTATVEPGDAVVLLRRG